MNLDVVDLKAFYYRTPLGRTAQRAVRGRVREFWPTAKGMTVAGFGFAVPLLRPFLGEARRVISLMPGPQGVTRWPESGGNISVLCRETLWPIQTGFIDRLVVMHGLEVSDRPDLLLAEIWRTLAPGGRVLFIVPNRSGLWSRRDITPFGQGRPFSLGQLESQLKRFGFVPERHEAALFSPPSQKRFWLKISPAWERIGRSLSSHVAGGVLLVEASKQVYAPKQGGSPEAVRRPLRALEGIGRPIPKPVSGRS
jgi:SAM-dependent methyltransferase